jgi:pyruvate,water dikinase
MHPDRAAQLILWFDEITIDDVPLVGGKNASLGEMYQHLSSRGVSIPWGFAIAASYGLGEKAVKAWLAVAKKE